MPNGNDIEDTKDVRFFAIATAVSGVLYFIIPFTIGKAFALIGLLIFGWQFAFEAATNLSSRLTGLPHRTYQVAVALLVPLIMSLFLVFSSKTLDASVFINRGWSPYDLLIAGILGYFGWIGGDLLNAKHTFRGYWIAATALFVLNFMWHNGMISVEDYYGESSSIAFDKEKAANSSDTGHYFFHYLYQVAIVYSGIFARQIREYYHRRKIYQENRE